MLLHPLNLTTKLKTMDKTLFVTAWLLLSGGSWIGTVAGLTDWSLVGWAFAGSTGFVVWEVTQPRPIQRKGWHRLALIAIGMVVSLGFNQYASEKTGIPIVPVTIVLGAVGYKLFSFGQKKADRPDDSIKDITGLK